MYPPPTTQSTLPPPHTRPANPQPPSPSLQSPFPPPPFEIKRGRSPGQALTHLHRARVAKPCKSLRSPLPCLACCSFRSSSSISCQPLKSIASRLKVRMACCVGLVWVGSLRSSDASSCTLPVESMVRRVKAALQSHMLKNHVRSVYVCLGNEARLQCLRAGLTFQFADLLLSIMIESLAPFFSWVFGEELLPHEMHACTYACRGGW